MWPTAWRRCRCDGKLDGASREGAERRYAQSPGAIARVCCLSACLLLPCTLSPTHVPPCATLQVGFKRTLLQDVKLFVADAVAFRADWEANGPTVPGLDPMDATDRLRKFQQLFEVRVAGWLSGAAGRLGACWVKAEQLDGSCAFLQP